MAAASHRTKLCFSAALLEVILDVASGSRSSPPPSRFWIRHRSLLFGCPPHGPFSVSRRRAVTRPMSVPLPIHMFRADLQGVVKADPVG